MMKLAALFLILIGSLTSIMARAEDQTQQEAKIQIHQAFNCSTFLRLPVPFASSTPEEPMEILTPRLIMRTAADSDYNSIAPIYEDLETYRNLHGYWHMWNSEDTRKKHQELLRGIRQQPRRKPGQVILDNYLRKWEFVMALRENNKMIGISTIKQYADRWEFSAVIAPKYRGQGFASERLAALIKFVRQIDPQARIYAEVLKTNFEIQSVIRKFRFRKAANNHPERDSYWLEPETGQ